MSSAFSLPRRNAQDAGARSDQRVARREIVATLALRAGLRVTSSASCAGATRLRARPPDLVAPAGTREVDMTAMLQEIFPEFRSRIVEPDRPLRSSQPAPAGHGTRTTSGTACWRHASRPQKPPERARPPRTRHPAHAAQTFISCSWAELPYVMAQVGHADENTTLRSTQRSSAAIAAGAAVDEMVAGAGRIDPDNDDIAEGPIGPCRIRRIPNLTRSTSPRGSN